MQASGAYRRTGGLLPLNSWAHLEIYVATVGINQSTVEVQLNGALLYQNRGLRPGTAGVGTVQIGNEAHQQAFDLVADNIVAR